MIVDWLSVVSGILLPVAMGYMILITVLKEDTMELSMKLSLSYGLGFGLLSQLMLVLGTSRVLFSLPIIAIILFVTTVIFYLLYRKQNKKMPVVHLRSINKKNDWLSLVFIIYILLHMYLIFCTAVMHPIITWDALATISFKGKIFYYDRTISLLEHLPHAAYPLFVPLIQTWIALTMGYWNDNLVKIIFPVATVSFLTICYHFLLSYLNRRNALMGTALLISSMLFVYHSTIAYRDLFALYYNVTTIILLLLWNLRRNDGYLLLAGLFSGFTTFTKLEGSGYIMIHTLLFLTILYKQGHFCSKVAIRSLKKFLIPSYGILMIYFFCRSYLGVSFLQGPKDLRETGLGLTLLNFDRIPIIIKVFIDHVFILWNWNIIWFFLIVSLLYQIKIRRLEIEEKMLLLSILLFFGFYFGAAYMTNHFISIAGKDNFTVLSRVFLHFYPLSVLLVMLVNCPRAQKK